MFRHKNEDRSEIRRTSFDYEEGDDEEHIDEDSIPDDSDSNDDDEEEEIESKNKPRKKVTNKGKTTRITQSTVQSRLIFLVQIFLKHRLTFYLVLHKHQDQKGEDHQKIVLQWMLLRRKNLNR
jgi:hypothetical protein